MIVVDSKGIKPIENKDEIVKKGPVYRMPLIGADKTGGFGILLVNFKPGAKLNFHTHSDDQILYITEGRGVVATKKEEKIVTPGMVVFFPAGEVHMHGATEDSSFSHIAIYKGTSQVV
jgi:quercetin dioxygenase-like cupin family protein